VARNGNATLPERFANLLIRTDQGGRFAPSLLTSEAESRTSVVQQGTSCTSAAQAIAARCHNRLLPGTAGARFSRLIHRPCETPQMQLKEAVHWPQRVDRANQALERRANTRLLERNLAGGYRLAAARAPALKLKETRVALRPYLMQPRAAIPFSRAFSQAYKKAPRLFRMSDGRIARKESIFCFTQPSSLRLAEFLCSWSFAALQLKGNHIRE
jgi:hypothetical protein